MDVSNPNPNASGARPANQPRIRPQDLTNALTGARFPASKDELVGRAQANGAVPNVVEALRRLPEDEFNNLGQVTDAFHDLARGG